MKKTGISGINQICYFICIFLLMGCAIKKTPVCIKDGVYYGKTKAVFLDEWHDYYRRALSFIEGGCYEFALSDLQEAVKIRFEDQSFARTYGMHFMHYFPHREMGYVFYKLKDEINAKNELELSLNQQFSDKAQYYLDKVRSSILKKRHVFIPGPEIIVKPPFNKDEVWIKESPVIFSASIKDTNYISRISLANEPVFLSSSTRKFDFQKELLLVPGKHEIEISAINLANSESKKSIVVHIDRSGPLIIVKKIDWNKGTIFGYLDDKTEDIQIWIDNNKISHYKGKLVTFTIEFKKTNKTIKLHAKDRLGNQTIAFINQNNKLNSGLLLASAQKQLPFLSDVDNSCYKKNNQNSEIILYGWNKTNTVYTNTIHINGFFKGNELVEQLMINKKIIAKKCKDSIFFNETIYLNEGNNKVLIESLSKPEHLSYSYSIEIYRKVPEHYQIKHRINLHLPLISLDTISFPATIKCDSHESNIIHPEKQQSCEIINKFKAIFIKQLKETKRFKVTCKQKASLKKNSCLIALINVFETKKDMEVFIKFVETETEHTFDIFDAYYEKSYSTNLKELSEKLIEKIKNAYQIHEEKIVKVNNNLIEIGPMKKPFMIHWPLIIFRKKPILYNPETGESLGADSVVIGQATTKALLTNGCKAILDDTKKVVVIKDHVIQR